MKRLDLKCPFPRQRTKRPVRPVRLVMSWLTKGFTGFGTSAGSGRRFFDRKRCCETGTPARCAGRTGVTRRRGSWLTTRSRIGAIGICFATRKTFSVFAITRVMHDSSSAWSKIYEWEMFPFCSGWFKGVGMNSSDVARLIVAGYLAAVVVGAPIARYVMIRNGARGFTPWREFWTNWGTDTASKAALAVLLYIGGFWA